MHDASLDYDLLTRFRDGYLDRQARRTTVDYAIANEGAKIYGWRVSRSSLKTISRMISDNGYESITLLSH